MSKKSKKTFSIAEFQRGAEAPTQAPPQDRYDYGDDDGYQQSSGQGERRDAPRRFRNTDGWSRDAFGSQDRDSSPPRERSDRGGYDRGGYERGGYDRGGYSRGGSDHNPAERASAFRRGGDGGSSSFGSGEVPSLRAGSGFTRNMFGSAGGDDEPSARDDRSDRGDRGDRPRPAAFTRDNFGLVGSSGAAPTATAPRSKPEYDADGFKIVGGRGEKAAPAAAPAAAAPKPAKSHSALPVSHNKFFIEEDDEPESVGDDADDDAPEPQPEPQPEPVTEPVEEKKTEAPKPAGLKKNSILARFIRKAPAEQPEEKRAAPSASATHVSSSSVPITSPRADTTPVAHEQQQQPEERVPRDAPQVTQLTKDTAVAWGGAATAVTPQATLSFGSQQPKPKKQPQQQPQQQKKKAQDTPAAAPATSSEPPAPRQSSSPIAKAVAGEQIILNVNSIKKNIRDITPFPSTGNAREHLAASFAHSIVSGEYSFDTLAFHWLKLYADSHVKVMKKTNPDVAQLKQEGSDIAKDLMIATLQQLSKTSPKVVAETFSEHLDEDLLKYTPSSIVNEPSVADRKAKLVAFYKSMGLSKCLNAADSGEKEEDTLDNASTLVATLVRGIADSDKSLPALTTLITNNQDDIKSALEKDCTAFFTEFFDACNVVDIDGQTLSSFMTALLGSGVSTFQQADKWRSDAQRTDSKRQTLFKIGSWFSDNEPKIQSYYDDEDEDDEADLGY